MAYKCFIKKFIESFYKTTKNVVKEEVKEIKDLTPTSEQYKKGEAMSVIAIAALSSMGIPVAAVAEPVIAKVFAYGIADLEAGVEDNQKLIIARVIAELKKAK